MDILFYDEQANRYGALDQWFHTPQGQHVAQAFAAELLSMNHQFSGDTLLQLGSCGDNLWLPAFKFNNKWLVTASISTPTTLAASLSMLPMERDSIDCVIAPLTMEVFNGDKRLFDEIDRILKPMGYAIFWGINPCSFWGLALYLRRLSCLGGASVTLTSALSVKHSMLIRGYRLCTLTSFYYIPPVTHEGLIKKLAFLNEMGKMIWPFPAGFYCFIVQKYQQIAPSLRQELLNEQPALRPKSALQAIGKWIHD